MGLLGKVFGGGLDISLEVTEEIKLGAGEIQGTLSLNSKDDTIVKSIKCDFAMIRTTASSVSVTDVSDIKILGSFSKKDPISIKGGEEKKVSFRIPIDWEKAEIKGLNKAIMDFAKIAESKQFLVTAQVKVKGSLVPKNADQVVNISK